MTEPLPIEPLGAPVDADVTLPGSKSLTNRALLCAALADGRSTLRGALRADDTEAMASSVEALGAEVEWEATTVHVAGTGGRLAPGPITVDARMSGTTARFVLPVLAFGHGDYRLTGHAQLVGRPMAAGLRTLRALGVEVAEEAEAGHLPVVVHATGGLTAGSVDVPGDASSQFLSGLLLAAPLARDGLTISVSGPLVSEPYVELTTAVMAAFGVTVSDRWTVAPQRYRSTVYDVEPDASAASYFLAAAAVCGGRVRVQGLGRDSSQGDVRFADVLAAMGAEVDVGHDHIEVRGHGELRGVDVDLSDLSDTAPTFAVVAACATTPSRATGIGFIRRKESDRIAAVVAELQRCGVDAAEEADGFTVRPSTPRGAAVRTYDDHRMAMSFAVLGLRVPGIAITDPGCVAKTFPGFFEALQALR